MNHPLAQPFGTSWPHPGSVVSVPIFLGYRHLGIVSDRFSNGKPMIISNSSRAGGTKEETLETFSQGRPVRIDQASDDLRAFEIVQRARSRLGSPYDLLSWNCEHLVAYARGLTPSSPQILGTLAFAALGLMIIGNRGA